MAASSSRCLERCVVSVLYVSPLIKFSAFVSVASVTDYVCDCIVSFSVLNVIGPTNVDEQNRAVRLRVTVVAMISSSSHFIYESAVCVCVCVLPE